MLVVRPGDPRIGAYSSPPSRGLTDVDCPSCSVILIPRRDSVSRMWRKRISDAILQLLR